jgi:hypothetical protein
MAAPATAGAALKAGVYHAVVRNTPATNGHNEGEGYIRVKNTPNGPRIVAPGHFNAPSCGGAPCYVPNITAPSWFGSQPYRTCNNRYNAAYKSGTTIPVKRGSFNFTGASAAESTRKIQLVGSWATNTTIKGYTRFKMANGCLSDKLPWKMTWIGS